MAVFPLFVDLQDKRCVVVGGGKVATRKTEMLAQFCSNITVISPNVTDKLASLIQSRQLNYIESTFYPEVLEEAYLIIAATSDKMLNERIHKLAIDKNCFVNVADAPDKCTFIFPSVVKRDELVIGISTSGGFPALSKLIRKRIENLLPQQLGEKLKALKESRKDILNDGEKALIKKQRALEVLKQEVMIEEEFNK